MHSDQNFIRRAAEKEIYMRRFLAVILSAVALLALASCDVVGPDVSSDDTPVKVTIAAPDGAPAISVASLIDAEKIGSYNVDARIVAGAEEIGSLIGSGEADMAVVPLNLAASLYNRGGEIKLVSVSVFGCLYMVGTEDIGSLEDLKGKIVGITGQSNTPDITLRYILDSNGIGYEQSDRAIEGKVAIVYYGDGSGVMSNLGQGTIDYGVLGEPAVTNCVKRFSSMGMKVVMNIQDEWKKATGEDYTQAGLVVSKKFYENSAFMNKLTAMLAANKTWAENNSDRLNDILTSHGGTTYDFTTGLLDRCNIGYKAAAAAKEDVESFFNIILDSYPNVIGGKLPDEKFYYGSVLAPTDSDVSILN